jgi:hypothetical protein
MSAKYGKKYNKGKPILSLVPRALKEGVAKALEFGADKYGRDNYKTGFPYTILADAVERHMTKAVDGEDYDEESGLLHLEHAAATIGMMLECARLHTLEDNRYKHGKEARKVRGRVSKGISSKSKKRKSRIEKRSKPHTKKTSSA